MVEPRKVMNFSLIGSITLFLVVSLFAIQVRGLSKTAQLFPKIVLAIMSILLLAEIVMEVKRGIVIPSENTPSGKRDVGFLKKRWIQYCVSISGYLILMYVIGYVMSSLTFMLVYPWVLGRRHNLGTIIFSLVLVAVMYATFGIFLNVPLPGGILFPR